MNMLGELLDSVIDGVFGRKVQRIVALVLLVVFVLGGAGWLMNLEVQSVRHAIQPYVHFLDKQIRAGEHPTAR